jgi:hypothetical protein
VAAYGPRCHRTAAGQTHTQPNPPPSSTRHHFNPARLNPGSQGSTRIPSADDVRVAAIELVLSGAGLPKVGLVHDGHPAGAGFQVVPLTGAAKTYAAVSWYKDGKPGKASDGLAEMLGACERVSAGRDFMSSIRSKPQSNSYAPGGKVGSEDSRKKNGLLAACCGWRLWP